MWICPIILLLSKFSVDVWPWTWGHRQRSVGGLRDPLETVTKSSNHILLARKLTKIWKFMYFFQFGQISWSMKRQRQFSISQVLKPFRSQSQTSNYFDCALRIARYVVNSNFPTSTLWRYFLCQGLGDEHHFEFCVLLRRDTSKISFPSPWAYFATHKHVRARMHHSVQPEL